MTTQLVHIENDRVTSSDLGSEVLRLLGIKQGSILVSLLQSGAVLVEKETADVDD